MIWKEIMKNKNMSMELDFVSSVTSPIVLDIQIEPDVST